MSIYKSKAEERRAEWLLRQYAADRASGFTYEGHAIPAPDTKLDRLRAAVVDAAMAWWRSEEGTYECCRMMDACAALDAAEKEVK